VLLAYTVALTHGVHSHVGIAYILIGMFALALRNSWDLLVELHVADMETAASNGDH
jgi:hypothetical protein